MTMIFRVRKKAVMSRERMMQRGRKIQQTLMVTTAMKVVKT